MSFDWANYLRLAEYMNEHTEEFPSAEACYRAVASRAYYAVFCLTRNYVRDQDGKTFHGNDHQALQRYLIDSSQSSIRRRLGNRLRQLHQIRIKVDYYDDLQAPPENTANQALSRARKILNDDLNQL